MKTIRLLLATALALVTLLGVALALAWWQPATASAEGGGGAPTAPQTLPLPWLSDDDVVDAPYHQRVPAVNGRIDPGEYAGAGKVTFPGYNGDMEVFFKQDGGNLYIAFDSPDTTAYPYGSGGGTGPAFQVFLDTANDKASAPQPDDYRLTVDKGGNLAEDVGTSSGWGSHSVVSWTAAVYTASWGWQAEFRIDFSKLGITQPGAVSIGLGVAEVWTPSWPHDWYWPEGGDWDEPDTWGTLVSSSDWGAFYWKPGPWEDYAPSGMPDFDQRQDEWSAHGPGGPISTHCGPVAMANSLWWFDSKFETPDHPPLTISDTYRLVRSYGVGTWDDHAPQNVVPLVDDLAWYFDTNGIRTGGSWLGTYVTDMHSGTLAYLRDHGLWDDYIVTLVERPDFRWVADEVMRSEDVILLLGFWEEIEPGIWRRVGGHYVTVAGIDPIAGLIAFSDPFADASGMGLGVIPPGRVLSGTLIPHSPIPGHAPEVHNDAGNVSHDVYIVVDTFSPGGIWGPADYPWNPELFGANPHPFVDPAEWAGTEFIQVEVEFALTVSPYTWKASGEWLVEGEHPVWGLWQPWEDYAPNGVPDFDEKQDAWGYTDTLGIWHWSFCGPVAAANSLWWFDSKFEPNPAGPPLPPHQPPIPPNDNYTLVLPYGLWDDHDPLNVEDQTAAVQLVDDLALYFDTDGLWTGSLHRGTFVTDLYDGIESYLNDHNLRQGYVITMVNRPEFWWVAEEVEVSEDVILLLGFWEQVGADEWQRVGGHYLTLPGVDKQGGFVAFSDPYYDGAEFAWPYTYPRGYPTVMGRVANGWLTPHQHPAFPPEVTHNDAGNISHDVYRVIGTSSPGGGWGPEGYVEGWSSIENFELQNGDSVSYAGGPVQGEVEWAVAVSPVADVSVRKMVYPSAVVPGDRVTFTILFGNAGHDAENVVISDVLPSGLTNATYTYTLIYPGALVGHDTYTWTAGTLRYMEGGIITITAQVDPTITDPQRIITNTVEIATSSMEQYQVPELPNEDSASVTVQTADVQIAKSVTPSTLRASDWLTYTIVYTNHGPALATGTVITDLLHTWLVNPSYTIWTSYMGAAPISSGHYVWSMGDVPAAGWGIITVTAQVSPSLSSGGTLPNTASIGTATPERDYTNNSYSADATVTYYSIDLHPDSAGLTDEPGQTVTYTLTAHNMGNVVDTYDIAGTVTGESWTTTWPASVGPVAASGSAQFDVTVQIPSGASDGAWSQVVITATSQGDGSRQDASTLTTHAQSTITRSITVTPTSPGVSGDPGDTVCFTITITNSSNVTDTVDITHTFPVSWTVTFTPPPPYELGPGESQTVQVCITIPPGAGAGGTESGTVTVISGGDPDVSADVDVTVRVGWKFIYLPVVMRNYP